MNRKMLLAALGLLTLASSVQAQTKPFGADLWLTGADPAGRARRWPDEPASNFFAMFTPDAPWARTAAGTRVLEMTPAMAMQEPEADLARVFADLKRRGIKLAVEFGWLHGETVGGCGFHVEGFAHPGAALSLARRIYRLGGDLRYVAMDEPLFYGHVYAGQNACQFSVDQVAHLAAEGAAEVKSVFPQAEIGDIEPIGSLGEAEPALIGAWAAAYFSAAGVKLAFVHADIQWQKQWQYSLPGVVRTLKAGGIPYGIIYDGNGTSDIAWVESAEERFRAIEADPAIRPDQAVIQSWQEFPTQMLPEQIPGTLTNLALSYLQSR